MVCRRPGGAGAALMIVAMLQLGPQAEAEERMQLGVSPPAAGSNAWDFQTTVGDRVFFSEGSAELGTRARRALEAQAAWLARHPALPVMVEGHADDGGAASHNLVLSRRRAEAVRQRLIEAGIAPGRIRVVAHGRERQVATCSVSDCATQNRRAVTVLEPATDHAQQLGDGFSRRRPRTLR
jgi:outer membrane protein OmpA-like peptidoglycan-associated protein